MENTPTLLTPRLILRRFTPEDAPALFALLRDEEVNTFLPWFPVKTLEEAQQLSFLLGLSADEQERCFWRLK